jgi:hypothetical protein
MDKKLEIKLLDLLTNHREEWKAMYCKLVHLPTGISLWTANRGYGDLNIYEPFNTKRIKGWFNRRKFRKLTDSFMNEYNKNEHNDLIEKLKNYKKK